MNIESVANRKTLILRVSGELDMLVADDFRRKTDALMVNHCSRNLVLNLSGVNFIDSSGLGAILGRYKNITMGGGKVALVGATGEEDPGTVRYPANYKRIRNRK